MSIYHFTLLRHGESTGNADGVFQGQEDFPLTESGRKQVRSVASRWQFEEVHFDRIITSPLVRARETAEIISAALNIPIETNPDWIERDAGLYSGLGQEEARERYPVPLIRPPYQPFAQTGESLWDLYLRAGHAVKDLLKFPPGHFLVVSHGGILNMAMYAILGIVPQLNFSGARFRFGNAGFARLTYRASDHTWRLLSMDNRADQEREEDRERPIAGEEPVPFVIRKADLGDLESLLPVYEEGDRFHREALPHIFKKPEDTPHIKEYLASLIANPMARVFLAVRTENTASQANHIIGLLIALIRQTPELAIFVPRRYVMIDNLIVASEFRRQGAGEALMEAAEEWACTEGAREIELNVWEFNQNAILFYDHLGYETGARRMFKKL